MTILRLSFIQTTLQAKEHHASTFQLWLTVALSRHQPHLSVTEKPHSVSLSARPSVNMPLSSQTPCWCPLRLRLGALVTKSRAPVLASQPLWTQRSNDYICVTCAKILIMSLSSTTHDTARGTDASDSALLSHGSQTSVSAPQSFGLPARCHSTSKRRCCHQTVPVSCCTDFVILSLSSSATELYVASPRRRCQPARSPRRDQLRVMEACHASLTIITP